MSRDTGMRPSAHHFSHEHPGSDETAMTHDLVLRDNDTVAGEVSPLVDLHPNQACARLLMQSFFSFLM